MLASTPNNPSKRKQIDKMNKLQLMEEFRYHRQKKEEYENLIKELKEDVKELKDELNKIRSRRLSSSVINNLETRLLQTERRLDEQEQYTSWEYVDIVGLPENFKGKNPEATVLNVFEETRAGMEKRSSHVIYRLRNTKMVIAKVLVAEMPLQSFPIRHNFVSWVKKKLKSQKNYVNESL